MFGQTIWVKTVEPGLTPKKYKTPEGKVATVSVYTPNKVHIELNGADHVFNRLEVDNLGGFNLRSKLPGVSYEFRYARKGQGFKDKLNKYLNNKVKRKLGF